MLNEMSTYEPKPLLDKSFGHAGRTVNFVWGTGNLGEFESMVLRHIATESQLAKRIKALHRSKGFLTVSNSGESGMWNNVPAFYASRVEDMILDVHRRALEAIKLFPHMCNADSSKRGALSALPPAPVGTNEVEGEDEGEEEGESEIDGTEKVEGEATQ